MLVQKKNINDYTYDERQSINDYTLHTQWDKSIILQFVAIKEAMEFKIVPIFTKYSSKEEQMLTSEMELSNAGSGCRILS